MLHRRETLKALFGLTALTAGPTLAQASIDRESRNTILIQTSPIAGFQYYRGEEIWSELGLRDRLTLRRQPDNEYDDQAVEILWRDRKLGYIPRDENWVISQMMDRGCNFYGTIAAKNASSDPWERLAIDVNLII